MAVKIGQICFIVSLLIIAKSRLITDLPGMPPNSTIRQHNGFLNFWHNYQIHYWFVESEKSPKDPLLLWLSGGPGCSGLFALISEVGPYFILTNGSGFEENPFSWTKEANLLALEAPLGTGFSTGPDMTADDEDTAWGLLAALEHFFKIFPHLKDNEFYIVGESYGSFYTSALANVLLDVKNTSGINLKGIAVGNGAVDGRMWFDMVIPYAYFHGLVDQRFAENYQYNGLAECSAQDYGARPKRAVAEFSLDNRRTLNCKGRKAINDYFNRPDVWQALQIPENFTEWLICNRPENYTRANYSIHDGIRRVLDNGVKVVLYYGDLDLMCTFLVGEKFAYDLGYPVTALKKPFFILGKHAGYKTEYANLDLFIVKNAGHMVPTDAPAAALYILRHLLNRPWRENQTTDDNSTSVIDGFEMVFNLKQKYGIDKDLCDACAMLKTTSGNVPSFNWLALFVLYCICFNLSLAHRIF